MQNRPNPGQNHSNFGQNQSGPNRLISVQNKAQNRPNSVQNDFEEDDDFFNDLPIPEVKKEIPEKPFEYLKTEKESLVFKGSVVTLATKLKVINQNWNLSVIITDGTSSRQVEICPQKLQEWIGIRPPDYPNLTAGDKEKSKRSVQDLASNLCNFNGLIKLKDMKVVDLIQVNRGHLQQLKNRVQLLKSQK